METASEKIKRLNDEKLRIAKLNTTSNGNVPTVNPIKNNNGPSGSNSSATPQQQIAAQVYGPEEEEYADRVKREAKEKADADKAKAMADKSLSDADRKARIIKADADRQTRLQQVMAQRAQTLADRQAKESKALADKQAKENKEEIASAKVDATKRLKDVTNAVTGGLTVVNNRVNPVKEWIANQPTPGGITALLIFIGFMLLAAVPANDAGDTRLSLLYNTFLMRTKFNYARQAPDNSGAGASFGDNGAGGAGTNPPVANQPATPTYQNNATSDPSIFNQPATPSYKGNSSLIIPSSSPDNSGIIDITKLDIFKLQ